MIITDVDTVVVDFYRTNLVLVRVHTDDGVLGLGEATLEGKELAVQGAVEGLRDAVVGRDPTGVTGIVHDVTRDWYWRGGPVVMTALSALEMALWDISARALAVPVHRMLGGQLRDRVRAYANGWFSGVATPEALAEAARRTVATGFAGLKWDPFENYDMTVRRRSSTARSRRSTPSAPRSGATSSCSSRGTAGSTSAPPYRISRELEPFDPVWFEEPCPPDNVDALVDVRRRSRVPVAAGERWFGRQGFATPLARAAVDFIQPDVTHAGGISELVFLSTLASTTYVGFAPHNPSGPLSTAASLQLAATLPNFRYLEIMATDVPWRPSVTDERLTLTAEGDVMIPDVVGLGIELDLDEIARHPFTPHPMRLFADAVYDIRPADERSYFNLPPED